MSVVDQKTLFSQIREEELVESRDDTYTPEQFEFGDFDGVDIPEQTGSFVKEDDLETFKLQAAMLCKCKDCFKNRKIGGFLINAIALIPLSLINAVLFFFGLVTIAVITGFTPVSKDEVFKKKSVEGA